MPNNFSEKLNNTINKKLLSNFFSLSSIQLVSYILPIITIPYLVRVLGVEKFGLIAFAQAIIQYFIIFTDYGFGLSATKEIAQENGNKKKINQIFSSVIIIKAFLVLVSFLILLFLTHFIDIFKEEAFLYFMTFGVVIGQAIFPVWYFQGIEKMHITAIINILPKIIFTLSIFIFVTSPDDYVLVVIINSLGFIISGLLSLIIAFKKYNVKLNIVSFRDIKKQFYEGWHIFIGIISSNFSMLNVTFFLGILTNPILVGYYSAVEKIIRPLASLNRPIISAIFPHLSKISVNNKKNSYDFSKKITFYVSLIMGIMGLILFIFSNQIVLILFGKEFTNSSDILKIMAFIPMIHSIIHIFLIPNMIVLNYKKIYSRIVFYSFILSVIFSYILITLYGVIGASFTTLFIDFFTMIAMIIYLRLKESKFNDN